MVVVDFDFKSYIHELTDEQLIKFANLAGTTPTYIKRHLVYRSKLPSPSLIDGLVLASNGDFTKSKLIQWLYQIDFEEIIANGNS